MIIEFVTIREEIANLKHYFSIQAIRYAGSFHTNYEIDPELEHCMLPKLILQPLAENSVLHGSYNDGTIMEIFVRCFRKQDDIVLEVADLGKGFDMNDKASAPKGLGGIGSRNVNDRIHLYFSDNYGLTVTKAPRQRNNRRILIPAIVSETENAKGGNYVSSTDSSMTNPLLKLHSVPCWTGVLSDFISALLLPMGRKHWKWQKNTDPISLSAI